MNRKFKNTIWISLFLMLMGACFPQPTSSLWVRNETGEIILVNNHRLIVGESFQVCSELVFEQSISFHVEYGKSKTVIEVPKYEELLKHRDEKLVSVEDKHGKHELILFDDGFAYFSIANLNSNQVFLTERKQLKEIAHLQPDGFPKVWKVD